MVVIAFFTGPSEMAALAAVAVFISLSQVLVDGGVGQVVVVEEDVGIDFIGAAVGLNFSIALVLALSFWFLSAPIGSFYGNTLVSELVLLLCPIVLLYSFLVLPKALMIRDGRFKEQRNVSIIASTSGAIVGFICAASGFGVKSILFQLISVNLAMVVGYSYLGMLHTFSFRKPKLLFKVLKSSSYLFYDSILSVPYRNAYAIVLPKVTSPELAGLFFMAEKVRDATMTVISNAVASVTLSKLSSLRRGEVGGGSLNKVILQLSRYVLPLGVSLAFVLGPICVWMLPERWEGVSEIVTVIVLAAVFSPFQAALISEYKALKLFSLNFKLGLLRKLIGVGVLFATVQYDIYTVSYGLILVSFLNVPITIFFLRQYLDAVVFAAFGQVYVYFFLLVALFLIVHQWVYSDVIKVVLYLFGAFGMFFFVGFVQRFWSKK